MSLSDASFARKTDIMHKWQVQQLHHQNFVFLQLAKKYMYETINKGI